METASINKVIQPLSRSEQLEIADRINQQPFDERWQKTDAIMPDVEF
jgi:hypothetical protein